MIYEWQWESLTQKWTGQMSWAQKMLSPGLSPIAPVAWCVTLNVISVCPHSEQRLIMCEHVWWSWDGGKRVHGPLQGVCFQRGFGAAFLESGFGCYYHVAENITEPVISNAWHFVVNLIYLHISCATVQTNQWAESRKHFLRPSSNWYQRGQHWK